jgi:hypothetical protein
LDNKHHETTPEVARAALIEWLTGDNVAENYDNLDLGDNAPNELLSAHCLSCHSKRDQAKLSQGGGIALDTWDDVRKTAFSTRIEPTNKKVMTASAHAHTLSLATLSIALGAILWATRFGASLKGVLLGVMGVSLLVDLGSWWIAREWAPAVKLIVLGGAAYNASVALSCVLVLLDLVLSASKKA